jgi:hypothetical protein
MTREKIIRSIVEALYHGCMGANGDGDAHWYTRYFTLDEILPIVEEYNSQLPFPMKVKVMPDIIDWGQGEEWISISPSEEVYKTLPLWYDIVIVT